ncbi:unnamed protein product [Calypogeia fissa]
MKIAVEGCAHGDLENIYATLQHLERVENTKIDLLICCGDFQAMRNLDDLESLACPPKYRAIGSFWKYYTGEEIAPYPTLFVGGNHEASNYLWELFYGGYVAPNIYFLGFAGVIRFGGVRVGGLSGIFKGRDYRSGHYERAPYDNSDMRSIYHIREFEVTKLLEVKEPVDIFLSHDWPNGIVLHGNKQELLRRKPFLRAEVEENSLGSRPAMQILQKLKPKFWFSAHMHVKFAAVVNHPDGGGSTKFLALDKCLPGRDFLQVLEIPGSGESLEFKFDEEWLSITRAYHPYLPLTRRPAQLGQMPSLQLHRQWVKQRLNEGGGIGIPDFAMTAEPYNPSNGRQIRVQPAGHQRNPQTRAFLDLLQLQYTFDANMVPNAWGSKPADKRKDSTADPYEVRGLIRFLVISCFLALSCLAEDPSPKPWPEQFHARLFQQKGGVALAVTDLWYDWPNGRNFNIIQHQLSYKMYDVEWNNGTSYYFDLEAKTCTTLFFEVGILRPDWLDHSHYLGEETLNGFTCNVWEKADFITYYEDKETRRPVGWLFRSSGQVINVMSFEVGAILGEASWQAPSPCFTSTTVSHSSLLLSSEGHSSGNEPWKRSLRMISGLK